MIAFDFYINGKKVCTAGMDEPGVVASTLTWVRGFPAKKRKKGPEDLGFRVGGLFSRTNSHVTWLVRQLSKGDSVRIDVIDAAKVDRPKKGKNESRTSRMRREQEYVAKKAASWGWEIQK